MTSALRVGLVYDDSLDRPGGVAQHVETLAGGLRARGHHVTLLVGESSAAVSGQRSLARNLKVRFNGNVLSVPLWARGTDLDDALADVRPDVLHVQLPYSPLLAGRLIRRASLSTAVLGTSHVFSERSWVKAGARLLSHASAGTHRRFDRVLAVSHPAQAFAERYSGMRVDAVVPNMVDLSPYRRDVRSELGDGWPHIVFVGSLVPRKGVVHLIGALSYVLAAQPNARLTIAGDGPLRTGLRRQARALGVGASVRFLGRIDEPAKMALLRDADVACFPSLYGESFGIVLLEAMAVDTPVVVGDNAGYRSVLGQYPEALVDPRDHRALGEALLKVCGDADRLAWHLRWQRQLVLRYDIDRVCDEIVEEYARALARRRPQQRLSLARVA